MQFLTPKIRFRKELQRKPFSLQDKERPFGGTDEELFVISFFVFELRKDVCVVLAFDTPFSTLYSLFIVSGNSKAKKLSVIPSVLLLCTLEVQSCHADDRPRKDFWLIVLRIWAYHSARTAKATALIFAVYFLYLELFKNSKF